MRRLLFSFSFLGILMGSAWGWGQEGHSIIAEIAQTRLKPATAAMIAKLFHGNRSLASVASWADDIRDERPETYNWHFVDIPINVRNFNKDRDCKKDDKAGDCIVLELDRLKKDLRCAPEKDKIEALKFTVHFIGDIHQPLHTVLEQKGGNDIKVDVFMRGLTCTANCEPTHIQSNLHAVWDTFLIEKAVWDWGAYVDRLEDGWLKSTEAMGADIDGGTPIEWAEETHKFASTAWNLRPADNILDDRYFRDVLPILDRQLGVAGLRLAKFLNEAATDTCPPQ